MYFLNKRVVFASLCSPNFYSYLIQTQLRQRKQKKESHSGNQSSSHRRRSSSQSPKPHSGFNYFLKEQSTVLEYNKKYFKHLTYITIFHCPFVNTNSFHIVFVSNTMGIHYVFTAFGTNHQSLQFTRLGHISVPSTDILVL